MLFKTKSSRTSPETTGEENTGQKPELDLVDLFSVGWDLEQRDELGLGFDGALCVPRWATSPPFLWCRRQAAGS